MEFCAIKLNKIFAFPEFAFPIIRAFLGCDKQKTLFVM